MYHNMYPSRGMSNRSHRESRHSYEDEGHSRDTSKYVSQYGGTTEIYYPASGRFREFGYGRIDEPPAYDNSKPLCLFPHVTLVFGDACPVSEQIRDILLYQFFFLFLKNKNCLVWSYF
jgi:hypothetical protein